MGRDIRYQVSAWKIYKVKQWWSTHKAPISHQCFEGCFPTAVKPTLVLAAMEKIISSLILSVFSSTRHRLGALAQLNQMFVAQQEDVFWCAD